MANLRVNNLSGEGGRNAYRGSVFFDGQNTRIEITASSDLALGTGDYTIEAWVRFSKIDTYQTIIDFRTSNGNYPFIVRDTDGDLYYFVNGSRLIDNIPARENNVWHHIAVVRSSGTTKFYLNGVSEGSASDSTNYIADQNVDIGASTNDNDFFGYISNLRITKEALYTSTFTPPYSELEVLSNTVLLCCQDSDDPTQEATGKTLTGYNGLSDTDLVKQQPKVIPPYGVDDSLTFNGPISLNTQGYMHFPTGRTDERGRGRAVFMGGNQNPNTPKVMDTIDFVDINSEGVGVRFGSLTTTNSQSAAFASSTRGINAGGSTSAPGDNQTNIIEFVTIATEGNGTDFGDLDTTHRRLGGSGHSSQTRGIITGGSGDSPGETNVIQFVTIATIGNATDFGDLLNPKDNMMSKNGSSTRMLICGGRDYTPSATATNVIEFLTIATTGNSADFGDLTQTRFAGTGCGSATRGIIAGGQTPTYVNTIDFVTIASAGNATDFGDLISTTSFLAGASNSIKGIFAGGATPTKLSSISSIEIATTGNAVTFGDNTVTNPVTSRGSCSDSHGGL